MKVLLVDNHDSYTHNLAHLIAGVTGVWPQIVKNDVLRLADVLADVPDAIVLSPGPGRPDVARDVGICPELLAALPHVPTLGVCLGMQLMAHVAGGTVGHARHPRHGRTSPVTHDGTSLFATLPQGFAAMRYHSLAVSEPLPDTLVALAHSDDGELMALRHRELPRYGVQFHPESVATEHGHALIARFLGMQGQAPALVGGDARTPDSAVAEHVIARPAIDPLALFATMFGRDPHAFLFHGHKSRFSIMGCATPTTFATRVAVGTCSSPFASGLVCVFDYENLCPRVLAVEESITIDHVTGKMVACARALTQRQAHIRARHLARSVEELVVPPRGEPRTPRTVGSFAFDKTGYLANIARCQSLIRHGEAYELCLTNRYSGHTDAQPFALFTRLAAMNPSPYSAYIQSGSFALLSSSPERFVHIATSDAGTLTAETRPIKGTRRRGADAQADRAIAHALATSAKDRAENLMIVDVCRHDLGTHAQIGAVSTPALLEVETHPSVFQLVSTVRATMRPNTRAEDIVHALFPPASMTGAPKERAIAWLAQLEMLPRGVYSGAFGYFDDRGGADLAVTIRSLIQHGDQVAFGTGGAILLDSDPEAEWQETLDKARPLLSALAVDIV